jgi:hypothetical protein
VGSFKGMSTNTIPEALAHPILISAKEEAKAIPKLASHAPSCRELNHSAAKLTHHLPLRLFNATEHNEPPPGDKMIHRGSRQI